jgi:hypothetical protein
MVKNTGTFGSRANILYSMDNLSAARMVTLDMSYFSGGGQPVVLIPGTVISRLPSGLGRAYPSGKSSSAVPTTARVLTFPNVTVFKAGDVLVNSPGGAAIGTVQSVDPIANTVTLVANTTTAIAIGDLIVGSGTPTLGDSLGIIISEMNITDHSNDVACYHSAIVYAARMPYWDTTLQTKFPGIVLVDPSV